MAKALERWEVLPHSELIEIDDGILAVTGDIAMPLANFQRRMTVVGLTGGRTAIYSAIALPEPDMARIEALGAPSFLVVPGAFHRMDAKIWKQRYPNICVVAPPGARAKVEEVVPVDTVEDVFGDVDTKFTVVAGTGAHEAALLVRRPSRLTVICNDIIGNVQHPHGVGENLIARLFGFGVTRPKIPWVVKYKTIKGPAALAAQLREWAALPDLRRVIVSHGEIIENPRSTLIGLAETLV